MSSASSILMTIKKPLRNNRRLYGLITAALLIIGLLFLGYTIRIKNNKISFEEYRFQTLDSYYNVISKRIENDIQIGKSDISENKIDNKSQEEDYTNNSNSEETSSVKNDTTSNKDSTIGGIDALIDEINTWLKANRKIKQQEAADSDNITRIQSSKKIKDFLTSLNEDLKINGEFDEYIIYYTIDYHTDIEHNTIFDSNSSLSQIPISLASLYSLSVNGSLALGVSTRFPSKDTRYQLFAKAYQYDFDDIKNVGSNSKDFEIEGLGIKIVGLVSIEKYNRYIHTLDSWIVALLTAFLLLCLFGLPFFKMIFIAEDERLFSKDVILTGVSIIIGVPVLLMILLALSSYHHEYYNDIPQRLEYISGQIAKNFEKENDEAVECLSELMLEKYRPENDANEYFSPKGSDVSYRNNFKIVSSVRSDSSELDPKGKVEYSINFIKEPPKKIGNLGSRWYFKDWDNKTNIWQNKKGVAYVMRPVVSIEDGSEEAVYILKSQEKDNIYKIGSSQLKSVHDPILPFGYQFAILDDRGDVWFHSEPDRSTLENLFKVSRNYSELFAALKGGVAANGFLLYRGEKHLFYTRPIQGANLSIVTLFNVGLLRIEISEVLSICSAAIFIAFFLKVLIAVLSLLTKRRRFGLYKYKPFLFEFLTPQKDNRKYYIVISLFFMGAILLLVPVFFLFPNKIEAPPPATVFGMILLWIIWSYVIVYYILCRGRSHIKFSERSKNPSSNLNIKLQDVSLILIIVLFNVFLFRNVTIFICLILVQSVIAFFLFIKRKKDWNEKVSDFIDRRFPRSSISTRYWYTIFVFSWLLTASAIPAALFFNEAKNINDVLWVKIDQLHAAKKYGEKEKALHNNKLPRPTHRSDLLAFQNRKDTSRLKQFKDSLGYRRHTDSIAFVKLYREHLHQGQYIAPIDKFVSDTTKNNGHKLIDWYPNLYRKLLWETRPIYDERVRPYQALAYTKSADGIWESGENTKGDVNFNYRIHNDEKLKSKYRVENKVFRNEKQESGNIKYVFVLIVKVFLIISLLFLLFGMLFFFIDRFFGLRFMYLKPNDFDTNKLQNYPEKFAEILKFNDANSGILLVGLPFSGKKKFAKELIEKAGYTKWTSFSFLRLDNLKGSNTMEEIMNGLCNHKDCSKGLALSKWEEYDAFIIENLEHDLKSIDSNKIKLRLISFLISKKKRIVIASEVYPSQILGFYDGHKDDFDTSNSTLYSDFNAWRNILSAFPQVLIGITDRKKEISDEMQKLIDKDFDKNKKDKLSEEYEKVDTEVAKIVGYELGYSKFLPTLAPSALSKNLYPIKDEDKKILTYGFDEQRMVMHVQNLAHGYYTDIWNTLPTRERYMLYDLAKDDFLNIKNRNSLFSLMKKGLIVWRNRPMIFNRSFKNFIISSVSLNEALRLEHKNRDSGSWGTMRIVFYFIIIIVIALIFFGRPDIVSDFQTMITALGGLGAIIPIISALLARNTGAR